MHNDTLKIKPKITNNQKQQNVKPIIT